MDVLLLSRIQFTINIAFHYLYPPLSIGLSLMIVIMESLFLKKKKEIYRQMAKFWTKIFSLTFALGVATGLVQVFSFGNNWARYSRFVGNVFGSALASEGIFAFFLEAGFIGIMLFGWDRFSRRVHYISSICVMLGAHFSAVWIVAANSWMQTPAGFKLEGTGKEVHAVLTSFWKMIFNPSFLDRLTHVIIGCWLTGAFMVISVSAYYFLRKRELNFAKHCMKIGLIMAFIFSLLQLISADSTGRGVAKNQPEKFAAMEGIFKTQEKTAMNIVGVVDAQQEKVHALQIPGLLSFLIYRDFKTPILGLENFPKSDWPPVSSVFQLYHLMIYMWGAMFLAVILGLILWKRKRFEASKWINRYLIISILFPFVANQAGWFTAELGRQPWIVYHLLKTSEGVSESIVSYQVISSITMFIFIYILLFILFLFLMNRKIKLGPMQVDGAKKTDDTIYRDPYRIEP